MNRNAFVMAIFLLVILTASAQQTAIHTVASSDAQVALDALRFTFDAYASEITNHQYDNGYSFFCEQSTKQISKYQFAAAYKMLEAEHGNLRSIRVAATWTNYGVRNASVKLGMVVARHHYEFEDALLTYIFRQERGTWKLVGFKPGNHVPGATVK